jgi:thymidylate synthase (FAD)
MKNITVKLISKPEFSVPGMIGGMANLTQFKKEFNETTHEKGLKILKSLTTMGHTSLLECADFAFIISGASRVFLAQITRHRHSSFTSQSQQYQDHDNFPYMIPESIANSPTALTEYKNIMVEVNDSYIRLKSIVGKDDARYVLPGGAKNDLYMKINLRELVTVIMPQRLCRRNTPETRLILGLMIKAMLDAGFEDCVRFGGCACVTEGKCDQGKFCCGMPFKNWEEMVGI